MRTKQSLVLAAALVFALHGVVACGDDDNGGGDGATESGFVAACVNQYEVCYEKEGNEEIDSATIEASCNLQWEHIQDEQSDPAGCASAQEDVFNCFADAGCPEDGQECLSESVALAESCEWD